MGKKQKTDQLKNIKPVDLDQGNLAVDLDVSDLVPERNNKLAVLHEEASSLLAQVDETPRDRLLAAVSGKAPVKREDVEALLADHILESEDQAKDLGRTCKDLTAFLLSSEKQDPNVTLDMVTKLTALHQTHASEMRKTIELLARIQRPRPPQIQVIAVDSEQLNVGDKQVIGRAVGLGGRK